ncbi:MAG: alanine racemase [Chromatiales bacterium]|jgi:alanine racemase
MGYAPRALIDHAALRHNLRRAREAAPQSRIWAVLKADAYGHGLERVARSLGEADGFAVSRINEALCLRGLGIGKPILILGGCYTLEQLELAAQQGFEVVLHQHQQFSLLEALPPETAPRAVWLKVDTGMHRLGYTPMEIEGIAQRLLRHPQVESLSILTHLANADDPADSATEAQLKLFDSLPLDLFRYCSIANSGGILGFPASHRDWVRPGIMLYGVSPFIGGRAQEQGLRPVMTLRSRVISVKQASRGDPIGYGGRYRCPEAMPVAVVAVGYGDGYPRHAPDSTPVLVGGRRLPLIGRVSMDLITLDARGFPDVQVGEEAVLWGDGLPVEEVAEHAGTIAYQLFCNVTNRVEFIDVKQEV